MTSNAEEEQLFLLYVFELVRQQQKLQFLSRSADGNSVSASILWGNNKEFKKR